MGAAHTSEAHCSFLPLAHCAWLQSHLLINGCAQIHCLADEVSVGPNPAACGLLPKENTRIDTVLHVTPGDQFSIIAGTEIKGKRWEKPPVP